MAIPIYAMYANTITIARTMIMSREKTGGVRLANMLQEGKITKPYLWIDTYNSCVNDIAGTIKARIDSNCMYFVSVIE